MTKLNKKVNSIAIYHNLPSGGAKEIFELQSSFLSKKSKTKIYSDSYLQPKNFLHYLYIALLYIPLVHRKLARKISSENDVLVAYQNWITNSPPLLRYVTIPTIYICHESMREYYDKSHIDLQTVKERLINSIRLPVKVMDYLNVKSQNITVVANSIKSKNLIKAAYRVESTVIYPGIDTRKFARKDHKTQNTKLVISVGSINKLKNQKFIVETLGKIPIKYRPKLVLVGNGGDPEYISLLKRTAKECNVNLRILLNSSKKKLINLLWKSSVFIYSPISEPFGIVIEEALAAGLIIIAHSNGGGYSEIISPKEAILINSSDQRTWANQIVKTLNTNRKYLISSRLLAKIDAKRMNNELWSLICRKV